MNPLYSELLQALGRWAISMVIAVLVTHHIITVDQSQTLTADLVHKLILYSPAALPLLWAGWNIFKSRIKFMAALAAPAYSTESSIDAHIASGATIPSVLTPPTVPGIPKV